MKVCTDACLFGAWVAKRQTLETAHSILDIGAGTGLLSLILAQVTDNNNTKITAVEIESQAAAEASSNFNLSKWSERLMLVNDSIQNYAANFTDTADEKNKFDIIITNPLL